VCLIYNIVIYNNAIKRSKDKIMHLIISLLSQESYLIYNIVINNNAIKGSKNKIMHLISIRYNFPRFSNKRYNFPRFSK
jgi:hypothetical protein